MLIPSEHEMLDLAGIALIANLFSLIVSAFAILGIYRARAPNVLLSWLIVAVGGLAVVICGTTIVIASE
jgi:hypothetical protein